MFLWRNTPCSKIPGTSYWLKELILPCPRQRYQSKTMLPTLNWCVKVSRTMTQMPLHSEMRCLLATAKPPMLNISKEEREALKTLDSAIKKMDMLILSQDKGRTIVLEDPSTYVEMLTHLKDARLPSCWEDRTYVRLDMDPTKNIKRKLTEKLKALKDAGKITY